MKKIFLFLQLLLIVFLCADSAHSYILKDIKFYGVGSGEGEKLKEILSLRSGVELDNETVGNSIKILFMQKNYKNIAADFDPASGTLTFSLDKVYKTGLITINKPPFPAEGMDALFPKFKGVYWDANVKRNIMERISEICLDNGYFQPVIKINEDRTDGIVNISFDVIYGQPYIVDRIIAEGGSKDLKNEVIGTLEKFSGKPYSSNSLLSKIEQIKKSYKKEGYYDFSLDLLRWETEDKELKVDLIFEFNEGPQYEAVFAGSENFSDYRLKSIVQLEQADKIDSASLDEAVERLKKFYKEKGFLFANVSASLAQLNNKSTIVFKIEEGKKVKITSVRFAGNQALTRPQLKEQMITKPYGLLSLVTASGTYHEDAFEGDIEALTFLYQTKGFLEPKLNSDIAYNNEKDEMQVTINIEEGVQTFVESIKFTGNEAFPAGELVKNLKLKPLAPLDLALIEEDKVSVQTFYNKNGYPYVEINEKIEFSDDRKSAGVTFEINEGKKVTIGKVLIVGNEFTREDVIIRHLSFKTGDTYNAENILLSQQKLRNLGLFQRVSISAIDFEKKPPVIDVVVNIEEKNAVVVEFGFGYESDNGIKGVFEVSHGNLLGDAIRVVLKGEFSPNEKNLLTGLRKPYLLDMELSGRVDLVYSKLTDKNLDYKSKKVSLVAGVDKNIFEKLKGSVQYEFEILDIFDIKQGAVLSFIDSGKTIIGTMSGLALLDLRDDSFNPRKGSYYNIKFDYASKLFGSEIEFVKLNSSASFFMPVIFGNVVALGIKGGYIHPFEGNNVIPISKRFFLGGRNTVRGFSENSIGPIGPDGSKIGGTSYFSYNFEYRIPVIENMWLAFFNDGGKVYLKNYKSTGPYLRTSAGVGLKYETPIGPLSFDYGYKLRRILNESPYAIHFSIGGTF